MKHRASMRREALNIVKIPDGMVRRSTSHTIDGTRYKTARSEGLRARCCSSNKSKLKPNAATDETSREATSMISCCKGTVVTYVNRRKDNRNPSACSRYWRCVSRYGKDGEY
jgi:hypothetical protein